jgi:phosphate transport system substrate-binding protein
MSILERFLRRIFTSLLHLLSICLLFVTLRMASAQTGPLTRLYVQPFTMTPDAEQLRDRVISELGKYKDVSIVSNANTADAVLEGGGEIWVKSYQSLNPRSGRLPSDGTPVYGGYLSVELTDSHGQIFWSDLVTPGAGTDDISKDLSKRIARHVAEAMQRGEGVPAAVTETGPYLILKGAGATFPQPVYDKWFSNYRRQNPSLEITYNPVGSEAGIRQLLAGHVDFGATDNPEAIRDLAPEQQSRFLLFPSVVGAVVPIVNLPGLASDIALTPEVLAGIYLGRITRWNDPLLKQCNRGIRLPDLNIVVVHRSDGSGTTYAWTDYLSHANAEWKQKVGTGLAPKWPVGKVANGNDGVAKLVKELGGSIGYVEYIYALQNHLGFARVRNQAGEFVAASLESMALATSQAVRMSDDFKVSVVNTPGKGAYPIVSFTWLVIPVKISDEHKGRAMRAFLEWMLGPGQRQAAALGYLALPGEVVVREKIAVQKMN